MKYISVIRLLVLAIIFSLGCVGVDSRIKIERFDRAVRYYTEMNYESRDSLLSHYAPVVSFMQRIENIDDADSLMHFLSQSRAVSVFQPDIERCLPDLSDVEAELSELKIRLALVLPAVSFPAHIYGGVIPYEQSIVVVDSILILGLNHYLGADYEGYVGFDDYRRRFKVPSRIVYDMAEALIRTTYEYRSDAESTTLSRLIYEGLVLYVVREVVPDADMASALGYSRAQIDWVAENESRIWRKMIVDNLLYSSDPSIAQRLVNPVAVTSIVNPMAPGRVGRYIGYRIVSSYLSKNPNTSVCSLFSDRLYQTPEMLVGSDYIGE